MSLAFRSVRIQFPSAVQQIQTIAGTAHFDRSVKVADASLKGFHVGYTNSDNELYQLEIYIKDIVIINAAVDFKVVYLLRDNSGNIDNPYNGWVDVLVTADVE